MNATLQKDRTDDAGATLDSIAPIVPVRSIRCSLHFYRDLLGFRVLSENADQTAALVGRGGARLMLLRVADRDALRATERHLSAYIWVEGVDRLFTEIAPHLDGLPSHRMRAPFETAYGMREFHVKDPDGFLLFFAESGKTAA